LHRTSLYISIKGAVICSKARNAYGSCNPPRYLPPIIGLLGIFERGDDPKGQGEFEARHSARLVALCMKIGRMEKFCVVSMFPWRLWIATTAVLCTAWMRQEGKSLLISAMDEIRANIYHLSLLCV
jgi:hypothetical protein